MKKLSVLALGIALAVSAQAKDSKTDPAIEAKMKKSDCFACHQVKVKVVGPSYKEIAKKYKGKKGAEALLVQKIKVGGAGNWGQIAMSAHPDLKDEDIKAMVKWVLAQK